VAVATGLSKEASTSVTNTFIIFDSIAMGERAALAAPLLLQSPPGQVANVYEDLTGLVGSEGNTARADEEEFKKLAAKVREEHNLQQHIVVDLPEGKGKAILCASAAHASGSGRFLAPKEQITFSVDHETLVSIFLLIDVK
jgi:capping protein alpha